MTGKTHRYTGAAGSSPGGVCGAGGGLGVGAAGVLVLLAWLWGAGGHGARGLTQNVLDALLRHRLVGPTEAAGTLLLGACKGEEGGLGLCRMSLERGRGFRMLKDVRGGR